MSRDRTHGFDHLDDVNLITAAGRETEVLRQVETFRGFHLSWLDENRNRARAADRLIRRGKIKLLNGDDKSGKGWCEFEVVPDGQEQPATKKGRGGKGRKYKEETETQSSSKKRGRKKKREEREPYVYDREARTRARNEEKLRPRKKLQ